MGDSPRKEVKLGAISVKAFKDHSGAISFSVMVQDCGGRPQASIVPDNVRVEAAVAQWLDSILSMTVNVPGANR